MAGLFDDSINIWLQNHFPWMEWPMKIITFFGDSLVYIILVAIAFWVYKKREAIIAMYVLLTTTFLNFFLKVLIQKPRPDTAIRLLEVEGFSTPSGHAQGSSTFYGWLMLKAKRLWAYIIAPILVLLICLSRVFLGVHYLGDVLLGVLLGIIILVGLFFGIPPLLDRMNKWPDWLKILVGEGYALFVFCLTFFLGLYANWPPGDASNTAEIVAALTWLPVIIWVEGKYIQMKNDRLTWSAIVLRLVIGLAVTIGAYFGLSALFDLFATTNYGLNYLYRFLRYSLVILILGLLMPFIFSKITWFSKQKEPEKPVDEVTEAKAHTG
jgi:membrane-associated phospholipid phosphatase